MCTMNRWLRMRIHVDTRDPEAFGALAIARFRFAGRRIFIFVVPPSVDELVRRQITRNTESHDDMTARREIATREMEYSKRYDHVVVNDELERAVAQILAIIQKARESQT